MLQETSINVEKTQTPLSRRAILIIGAHAFIGWALCTAAMVIPMLTTTVETALIIHAAGAPIIFTVVSLNYFNKYNFTTPVKTGLIFCFLISLKK